MTELLIFSLCTLCGTLVGMYFSYGYQKRVKTLNMYREMLSDMEIYIRYNHLSLEELFKRLHEKYSPIITEDLYICASDPGKFSACLSDTVNKSEGLIKSDKELLSSLSDKLGKSDTPGELSIISLTAQRLEKQIKEAEEKRQSKGRLSRTLGILIGAAFGIALV